MLRKFTYVLGVAAGGALVASCGGTATPTPTPTPTATPTPTPTPTATPTLIDFAQDFTSTSGLIYIFGNFTPTGGAEVFSDASRISGGTGSINFVVTPEEVNYAFANLSPSPQFLGADLDSASATMRTYVKGDEAMFLELPFQHVLRASYQRVDPFISDTVPGDLRSRRVTLFGNAITTADAIDSVMTYNGLAAVVGGTAGTTPSMITIAHANAFTVTPGDPSITFAGTIEIYESVGGVETQVAELEFTGTVGTNSSISGTIADAGFGFTGSFSGALAGPDREELAVVFAASHADGREYVGSYIGS